MSLRQVLDRGNREPHRQVARVDAVTQLDGERLEGVLWVDLHSRWKVCKARAWRHPRRDGPGCPLVRLRDRVNRDPLQSNGASERSAEDLVDVEDARITQRLANVRLTAPVTVVRSG